MIGTGGIGSGLFFELDGNHTLGREESRSGRFLHHNDYCKLHIISHYVHALMGSEFPTILIGKVGDDETGARLLDEMGRDGLDLRYVKAVHGQQTSNCICLVYPDGSGGNLTVADSACARVDAACIQKAEPAIASLGRSGIALAAPEVPLAARRQLLAMASTHGLFRVAAFTSAEMPEAVDMMGNIDLLAMNADEAAALLGEASTIDPAGLAGRVVAAMTVMNPDANILMTAGAAGSWTWDGATLNHCGALQVDVVSTAGAGDAFLGATLCGLACGLKLADAQQLAALAASLSVTSPHTIHKGIDAAALAIHTRRIRTVLPPAVAKLLEMSE